VQVAVVVLREADVLEVVDVLEPGLRR
jgi:hypothetical protein